MKTLDNLNLNIGDYPMKCDKYHVYVYIKREYMYRDEENLLEKLSRKYKGMPTGSGTNLSTGKRDMSFAFPSKRDVGHFLRNKIVKDVAYRPAVKEVK